MTILSDNIKSLREDGFTYTQIQERLGCSKGTISYHLGEGQVDKTKARQRRIRNTIRDYLYQLKQDALCADCGEDYPYWMMDFDHLEDKSFNICQWKKHSANLEIIKREVAKCEIVCANCHRNRTYLRWRNNPNAVFETNLDVSERYDEAPIAINYS